MRANSAEILPMTVWPSWPPRLLSLQAPRLFLPLHLQCFVQDDCACTPQVHQGRLCFARPYAFLVRLCHAFQDSAEPEQSLLRLFFHYCANVCEPWKLLMFERFGPFLMCLHPEESGSRPRAYELFFL